MKKISRYIFVLLLFFITLSITGKAQNDYAFQSFWQNFKTAIDSNNPDSVKSMIKFPLVTFYNLVHKKVIKKDDFGIGPKKYFDDNFLKKIKDIDKLTRTKFVIEDYARFDMTNLSLVYELKLDRWHHASTILYFAMVDGKIQFIGEDSFSKPQ